MQNDTDPVQQLIAFAKQLEPEDGYFGPGTLVDILDQDIAAMNSFRAMFKGVRAEELDLLDHDDNVELGWIIGGAADELDLLPDDPRLFKSDDELAVMKPLERQSELCSACIVNDVNAVAYLAPRTDVNRLDHNTQLALSYAVGNNHIECVKILLAHGADPNRIEKCGNTSVHTCAATVSSKEIIQLLIAAGGDLQIRNDNGQTPIDLLRELERSDWIE